MSRLTLFALMLLLGLNGLADRLFVLCSSVDGADHHVHAAFGMVGHKAVLPDDCSFEHPIGPADSSLFGDAGYHHHGACTDRSLSEPVALHKGVGWSDDQAPMAVVLPSAWKSQVLAIAAPYRSLQPRAPPSPHMAAIQQFCSLRLLI